MTEAAGPRSDTQCEPTTTEGSAQPPEDRAAKRLKMEGPTDFDGATTTELASHDVHSHNAPAEDGTRTGDGRTSCSDDRRPGLAPVKKEYLIDVPSSKTVLDDDLAEGRGADDKHQSRGNDRDGGGRLGRKKDKRDKRKKGQNTERTFGKFDDAIRLCNSRAFSAEFSPRECKFGDRCKLSHDLRKYLAEGRRADVETFGGKCPVFDKYRTCPSGWKCRFVKSHMCEVDGRDGRKELVLLGAPGDKYKDKDSSVANAEKTSEEAKPHDDEAATEEAEDSRPGIVNTVALSDKILLSRKRLDFTAADQYITWLDQEAKISHDFHHRRKEQSAQETEDLRAGYADPPLQAAEKRRLYFGPETPTLAPLTTQGNLPFRRLCVELGCQLTYSEMAMSMPLLQGSKSDWTLMKAHESEALPPKFSPGRSVVLDGYDNAKDLRFGAQISGNKPWMVTKAVDVLNRFCPHLRLIDLNCGCPIDMVYKSGGGSALLEAPGKMERMIRGMNAMSGPIPITAKIRTGVTNKRPTATQLLYRLAFGGREHRSRLGAPGCAAVTLHGRSREQRYTKKADWAYIGECAALIQSYNSQKGDLTDTAAEPDERTLANTKDGRIYFLGNGDCYSHVDYFDHIEHARVDSVMIGRGALIKPWIFEEIDKGQYLDKSSTERLAYVDKFVRYGLDAWGSDELGIGFTRRFLLEWLSFAHRYVPVGLLEHLPPSLNDRPPAYRGRDELETLMASENYRDWIKISEMFLGPAHPDFQFQPKHRSNAYEAEG